MFQPQAEGQTGINSGSQSDFDARFKLIRTGIIVAGWIFVGTVLGGCVGLFVYANSRTPNVHDGVFAVIQAVGVLLGVAMGFLAAKGTEAQDAFLAASSRAGKSMLRKYKPRPGTAGNSNVGQRTIGKPVVESYDTEGDEFLRTMLGSKHCK